MLLQTSLHYHNVSLSSSISYSPKLSYRTTTSVNCTKLPLKVSCSISQIHNYGTMDYERRPIVKWNGIYKKISLMEKPELGSASVLNHWENEGRNLTKWELCRVVKELRKYKRYERALEVYDWMNNRGERFRLSTSDAAIQLDLVAKVHGVPRAEDYFLNLPDNLKDRRIYGALLNAYVHGRMKEKAESLLEKMRTKGYATHPLPFNVMMTLYMNLKEYEKVESMVSEMIERNIQLDIYSYNIWLSSWGSRGSSEKMEEVYEQLKEDKTINANWTTFSTMATMYIKMRQLEKAEECLRKVESRITGRDKIPYHYLISLYGSVGNKEETYRVWNIYKTVFPSIPNLGYHAMISSLMRLGDVEGAEKIYEEWLLVKTSYDPRIGNLLLGWYLKHGDLDKVESFFYHMVEVGKTNSSTWETLTEGYIGAMKIKEAVSAWKEAFGSDGSKSWRPRPVNVLGFFKLCEEEGDVESKEMFLELLRQSGYLKDQVYASLIGLSAERARHGVEGERSDVNEADGSEMIFNELQGSF